MSIGYACLTLAQPNISYRRCLQKNATKETLLEISKWNLDSLLKALDYNNDNDIKLFRISSDLIPFGSSPVNTLPWWEIYEEELTEIGNKIKKSNTRVSMHPGQYTVLNSPNEDVVLRSIKDLEYHTKILDSFHLNGEHKIILHVGGIYGDKEIAINRFKINYKELDESIKRRLIIENDDKCYNVDDVLNLGTTLGVPVVYDNLHNRLNPYDLSKTDDYYIKLCSKLWKESDGKPKIHYSQQAPTKVNGSHSDSIELLEFLDFYHSIPKDIDIMLEVKDKNISAIKCILATTKYPLPTTRAKLQRELLAYKLRLLEHSKEDYYSLEKELNDLDPISFYIRVEAILKREIEKDAAIAAVLEACKTLDLTNTEDNTLRSRVAQYHSDNYSLSTLKNLLYKYALKQPKPSKECLDTVIESYYV